jgi:hypothetical protein
MVVITRLVLIDFVTSLELFASFPLKVVDVAYSSNYLWHKLRILQEHSSFTPAAKEAGVLLLRKCSSTERLTRYVWSDRDWERHGRGIVHTC